MAHDDITIHYDASRNLALARKSDVASLVHGGEPKLAVAKDINGTKFLKRLRQLGIGSETIDTLGRICSDVYLQFRDGGWVANFAIKRFTDRRVTLETPSGEKDEWDLNAYFFGSPDTTISLIDEAAFRASP